MSCQDNCHDHHKHDRRCGSPPPRKGCNCLFKAISRTVARARPTGSQAWFHKYGLYTIARKCCDLCYLSVLGPEVGDTHVPSFWLLLHAVDNTLGRHGKENWLHMYYSLKRGYIGDCIGEYHKGWGGCGA